MRVGGGLFRWTRVCARTTARMYLTLEYSRHPLSPAVAEGGGKKKEGLVSEQQEARCSADKRIFRLTTRDHILQLMRLDLTPRYFSPAPRGILPPPPPRYSALISRSKASPNLFLSFFLSNCFSRKFVPRREKEKNLLFFFEFVTLI